MKVLLPVFLFMFVLAGCGGGGGGGGGANQAPQPAEAQADTGKITVLVGDNALDGISAVLIDIEDILLLGGDDDDDDQGQISLIDGPINDVNLLDLQYVTTLLADTEVPAGTYSKIRLLIDSLTIFEIGDEEQANPIEAQLPANGKIDLNPQGDIIIGPGEELIVQVDIDLHRSIKVTLTGNSKYKFRPVIFVDVYNQGVDFRLSKLFGTLSDDDDSGPDGPGTESDYDLCTEANPDPCVDVTVTGDTRYVNADGSERNFDTMPFDDVNGELVTAFGHFEITSQGDFFSASIIIFGDENAVEQIEGDVTAAVVDEAFELTEDDDTVNSVIITNALLLDDLGNPLEVAIEVDQEAEAWALTSQLSVPYDLNFPAFLVQVRDDEDDEESVEGLLVDIDGNELTLQEEGVDICVLVDDDTEYQLLSDFNGDAVTDESSYTALGNLFEVGNQIEVEAYGMQEGDCFEASLIASEIEGPIE
jgi:hypothetical protein